jgi:toxin ParE1/3/4
VVSSVRLSPEARADFVEIRKYSNEQFSANVANAYFVGFDELFDLLRRHPMAGAAKPELGKKIRCIVHRKHRIYYILDNDLVLFVRIVHYAMDAKRALKGAAK